MCKLEGGDVDQTVGTINLTRQVSRVRTIEPAESNRGIVQSLNRV